MSTRAIAEFEKGASVPRQAKYDALRRALAKAGVEFIDEDNGGLGVRLKPPKARGKPK